MQLSIIIVSYNTRELLWQCLRRVFASLTTSAKGGQALAFEVFVVDNASSDGSAEMVQEEFPKVRLLENRENVGYAKANNLAIRKILTPSQSKYILLLNSDVGIVPDTLQKTLDYMEQNPAVGIAGPRVQFPDGRLDLACRRSFPDPAAALYRLTGLSFLFPKSKFARYNLTYLPENQETEVDSVMGAFMLIRREVIDGIGLLDEDYFMYGEDLDYCFRAKEAGWKIMYAPVTAVIHRKGSSSRRLPRKTLYEFHRAMAIFYDKHYRARYGAIMNFFVKIGIWARYLIKSIINAIPIY